MITINHNLDKTVDQLKKLTKRDLPKAAASAMNSCSYLARQKLIGELPKKFKIKRQWVLRQMLYRKVSAEQWPKLKGRVGSLFKALYFHEQGGARIGNRWPFIGVPLSARTDSFAKHMKGRPEKKIGRKNYHLINVKGKTFLIYKAKARKHKRGQVRKIEAPKADMLYVFKKVLVNRPRWEMASTVREVFAENYVAKMRAKLK